VRIYLNTSALNRPFDDLSVAKVRTEAEAVLLLVAEVEAGRVELMSLSISSSTFRRLPTWIAPIES
jgi:hypothetical protein